MFKKLLTLIYLVYVSVAVYAQSGSITGTVYDAITGESLPGVTIQLEEISMGTATNIDGKYTINNVPDGTYTLLASFIGFRNNEMIVNITGSELILDIVLDEDIFGLDEIVVTGVGVGTDTKKLGFSVAKISEDNLQAVPATDPGNALRAKIAGVTVVQATGDPLSSPDIRLRGTTTIQGSPDPLIIIDGVITNGSLRDINMSDVQSMEVIKGAAGASLYGSLAGNGVIQIITKRSSEKIGVPEFTYRSEYGFSEIAVDYPVATKHPFVNDAIVDENGVVTSWEGYSNDDSDERFDNNFPVLHDNIKNVFTSNPFNINSFSISGADQTYNYLASVENSVQGGVLENLDDYKRNSFRLNADFIPNDKFKVRFSSSYTTVDAPRIESQGQGDNYFYSALTAMPFIDLTQKNEDGTYSNDLSGYGIQGSNFENPLYVAGTRERSIDRTRLVVGSGVDYKVNDNFMLSASQSLDRTENFSTTYYPKGYVNNGSPDISTKNGSEYRYSRQYYTSVSEAWITYTKNFEDINFTAIAKYLYEDRNNTWFSAYGHTYPSNGIRNLGALDTETLRIRSLDQTIRAENIFLTATIDYQDKFIVDGLIRRDGSSAFGSDQRWATYFRGSLAYRLTEDIEINNVQEWKLRVSYGTSGQRPNFAAQYETFTATASGLTKEQLGNKDLQSSTIGEFEIGTNIAFLDKFSLEANYAITTVKKDYINVPLSSVAGGFSYQVQNIGELENKTLEIALQASAIRKKNMNWTFNIAWDKTAQKITDLGDVPPFTRSTQSIGGAALALFRVEAGEPYGSMYGNKLATSISDLTIDGEGNVLNVGSDTNGDGKITTADYEINSEGYVVPVGTHGTAKEQVTFIVDEDGEKAVVRIGDTNPNFKMGISSNFNYKGFGLYVLLDMVQGGDIYNYTKQLLIYNDRHKEQQELADKGFHVEYIDAASQIYNGSDASSYFVEDASYIKLREVSLSYTISNRSLGRIGKFVDEIRMSVSGRNLLTITDYTGWDPEVALNFNSTNFRLDEFAYPNYRTYTGSIQIKF